MGARHRWIRENEKSKDPRVYPSRDDDAGDMPVHKGESECRRQVSRGRKEKMKDERSRDDLRDNDGDDDESRVIHLWAVVPPRQWA